MLTSVKYYGNVGIGVTSPQLFRAIDRKIYVVKLQNNRLGSKVLVNELVAAKIGKIMSLCFPASDIIEITEHTIKQSQRLTKTGMVPGLHFASQYLNHTEYMGKKNLHKASNIVEMAGVMLFDHMFHNSDRNNNTRNILLRQEDTACKIYAIDNSHLIRSGRWTLRTITSLGMTISPYYRYSYGLLLREHLSPQDFIPYVKRAANISKENIDCLVKEIPKEWLPDEIERQALLQYITTRLGMVEEIWEVLCNYIPQSRGGRQWWHSKK